MKIKLPYVKKGLNLDLDDAYDIHIMKPKHAEPVDQPDVRLREAL